jgi:preprotein translocase subunit SecD
MDRSLKVRSLILVGIVLACIMYVLPTFVGDKTLPGFFPEEKIQLGLDLQGGSHIVYNIDLDKAIDDKASEIRRDLESYMTSESIKGSVSTPSSVTGAVTARIADAAGREKARKWLLSQYEGVVVERTCPADQTDAFCIRVSSEYADNAKERALAQAVETIRSRIDDKGVAEPTVISKGEDIIVELPGSDEKAISETKDIIARTAKLEFKKVLDDEGDPQHFMRGLFAKVREDQAAKDLGILADVDTWRHDETGKTYNDYFLMAHNREEWVELDQAKEYDGCFKAGMPVTDGKVWCEVKGKYLIERYLAAVGAQDPKLAVPDDRQIAYELMTPGEGAEDSRPFWRSYYMDRAVRLTGATITNAIVIWDPQTNRPEVLVEFNRYGTRVFGDLTKEAVGRKMAIILDEDVKSAPVIQVAITGGRSNISMGSGNPDDQQREADALVTVLKTGSLPAPLREESASQLGPTLGRDAIQKTQFSFALGVVLVLAIMIFIYRFSGLIAILAMLINILIMLTAMVLFGATLTLPGIAALVLTVGLAVDGNILIYERIRDELHNGKSVKGAVEIGFARAFTTVLDGHLTTAAAGWVLLQYGSGPIQGFAVMLLVGIGTTLFTTTWVTRVFFDLYVTRKKGAQTISI